MAEIVLNGIPTSYDERGHGDNILVWGVSESGTDIETMEMFPSDYHVYFLRLPNHYDRAHNPEFEIYKQWGEDIYAFSRALKLEKFMYMGLSRWGGAGFSLILDHPDAVRAFIALVSVPAPQSSSSGSRKTQIALQEGNIKEHLSILENDLFPPTTDKKRLARREIWRQTDVKSQMSRDRETLAKEGDLIDRIIEGRWKLAERLGEIKVPTLLIFGAKDRTNPLLPSITSAMTIPGAKAVFFQDYSHGLLLEAKELVLQEIINFVNSLDKAAGLT
jgi:pimeloyl-ACP methyl ester carboxylesterase